MIRNPKTARPAVKALRVGALLLGSSVLALTSAYAVTRTWTPGNNGWFTDANWTPNATPGNGDTVINNNTTFAAVINAAATANLAELDMGGSGSDIHVQNGGVLNVTNGGGTIYLGKNVGDTAALLNVTDAGSTVNANFLVVGSDGGGTASFNAGTIGAFGSTVIGANTGSNGTLTITGAGAVVNNATTMLVGNAGTAALNVTNGAVASTGLTTVGVLAGSSGTLLVDGANSHLTTAILQLGTGGAASLTVFGGGLLTSADAIVGDSSFGSATVSGTNSKWDLGTSSLTIGAAGTSADVVAITSGGFLTAGRITLGDAAGSRGTLALTDTGTVGTVAVSGVVFVGNGGQGALHMTAGAHGTIGMNLVAGVAPGSSGDVSLDGGSTRLTVSSHTVIGSAGAGTLEISDSAELTSTDISTLGVSAGSSGVGFITGTGSRWDNGDVLKVGDLGRGEITLSNGGQVTALDLELGNQAGSSGAMTLHDVGSSATFSNGIDIGFAGQGTLILKNRATVLSTGGLFEIAGALGSTGDLQIDGSGSQAQNVGPTVIGNGGDATMEVTNSGRFFSQADSTMAHSISGTATVTIDNGQWDDGGHDLKVGENGTAILNVQNAGTLLTSTASLGEGATGTGTVNIGDTNSHWTATGLASIGGSGSGSLIISAGGRVTDAAGMFIAAHSGSTGFVNVDGVGSVLDVTGNAVTVGEFGNGTMNVTNGGSVIGGGVSVGAGGAGTTAIVLVDGIGSNVTLSSEFNVGTGNGDAATATISNQGAVTASNSTLGFTGGTNGTLNITDIGSSLNIGSFHIGRQGTGHLNISSGATANATSVEIGENTGGVGAAVIDGFGSFLNNTGSLVIGDAGTGSLTLSNGAFASGLTGVTIASQVGSVGKLIIGADIGQAATGSGSLTSSTTDVSFGSGTGSIIFNHTGSNYAFAQQILGNGEIDQAAGVTHLTGTNTAYSGHVNVAGGSLFVDSALFASSTTVSAGAKLGGVGALGGLTTVADGGHLVGVQGQTLTLEGLVLNNASNIDVTLSNPGGNALFAVANDFTLDGKLNITAGGTFGPGTYRLLDYPGSITDNGLDIGTTPDGTDASEFSVQTDTVNKHVNLVDAAAAQVRFWDGDAGGNANNNAVDGGNGTWTVTSTNFTDGGGTANGPMSPQPGFAVFQGTPGVVTVDNSAGQVAVTGMQFAVDGYTLTGGAVSLANAQSIIRVGDGTAASSGYAATINDKLIGSGGIDLTDFGTLVLTAQNTYTGATQIDNGSLFLGTNGSISASSRVIDNAIFDVSNVAGGASIQSLAGTGTVEEGNKTLTLTNASDTFGGMIGGSGGLTVSGGTETLTGTQTYIGATTISGGTLALSGNGNVTASNDVVVNGTFDISATAAGTTISGLDGSGTVALGSNTLTIADSRTFATVFNGAITGTGGLNLAQGYLQLNGNNTYTGGTTIGSGTILFLGNLGTTGSIVGDMVDNGLLSVGRSDTYTYAGVISGTGAVEQAGTADSVLILSGVNTYTGGSFVGGGTLVGSATSFGTGDIGDFAAFAIDQPTNAVFANNITNTGSFEKRGAGVLSLTGTSTYTGGTKISAGTLQIGNGGTAGSIVGDVVDNATLAFNRSDAVTFGGVISGTGAVSQVGTGKTTLTGAETYTGQTNINAGILALSGAGRINSTSGIVLANAATFDISGVTGGITVPNLTGVGTVALGADTLTLSNAVGTFGGVISGTGGLVKQGTGAFVLTGASTYSGGTTVAAGRLAVNGSLANSIVTVQSGATLGGNGTVKGIDAQAGSTVGPGNSIGTLNVAGNYHQAAGSTYQVELTSTGQNDRINATGAATIDNGAILNVVKTDGGDYVLGTRYTVLTAAGGVNGAYALTGDLVTATYGLAMHQDANDVYLDVFRAKQFVEFGTTPNQIATGKALDTMPSNGTLTHALGNLTTDGQVTAALDQLSGEIHATAKTAAFEDSRFPRDAALGRLATAVNVGDTDSMHPSLWGQAYGSWGTTDGNGNAASMTRSNRGFLGGVDLPLANIWRVGFMGGYSRSSLNVKDRSSTGTADNYHLGGYAGMQQGALGIRVGAAYTWNDLTTARTVTFAGFNNNLNAQYNAGTTQAFGDVSYKVPVGTVNLEPFANLAYVSLHTGNMIETGGAAALTGAADTQNVTFTTLGLRGKYDITLGDTRVGLHADAGWRHAFGDLTPITALSFTGSSAVTIQGVPLASDGAAYGAGFDLNIAKDVLVGVAYEGQYAATANDNTIKLNLDWKL